MQHAFYIGYRMSTNPNNIKFKATMFLGEVCEAVFDTMEMAKEACIETCKTISAETEKEYVPLVWESLHDDYATATDPFGFEITIETLVYNTKRISGGQYHSDDAQVYVK